jgi:hypothetical protein
VKTDVEPDEAALYLDGKLIGTADDFDGYPDRLYLGAGHYRLEFRLDGYETYSTEIDAAGSRSFRIDQRLRKIKGAKHYGTYEPARPEGGVMRFWVKNGSTDVGQSREDEGPPRRAYLRDDSRGYSRDYSNDRGDQDDQGDQADADDQDDSNDAPPPEAPRMGGEVSDTRLSFDIEPDEAAVYIDGRFAGGARELNSMREGFSVEPGQHHVTVTCPGYRESTIEVTAGNHRGARVRLSLSR